MAIITSKFGGIVRTFSSINKEIDYFSKEKLKSLKITKAESIYIKFIYENKGATQYEIAKKLNMSKSLTIKHISNLEEKKILYKENLDLYKKKIYLTEKGEKIYKKFNELLDDLGSVIFENFTEEEVESYFKKLILAKTNLNKYNNRKVNESDFSYKK